MCTHWSAVCTCKKPQNALKSCLQLEILARIGLAEPRMPMPIPTTPHTKGGKRNSWPKASSYCTEIFQYLCLSAVRNPTKTSVRY